MRWLFLLFLFPLSCLAQTKGLDISSGSGSANIDCKYYALLIAEQHYKDNSISSLEFPIADAEKLAATLRTNYVFDSVKVIRDPMAADLMKTIYSYRKNLKANDNLLLFYSGHGYWDKDNDQGYWMPVDADLSNPLSWISNSQIKDEIKGMKCRHVLLVSDACFAGGIFKSRAIMDKAPESIRELYKLPSRKAMTSGALTEVPDKSVFLKYLVAALENNEQPEMDAGRLFFTARENAMNNSVVSGVTPQFGVILDAGDQAGEFIFIKKTDGQTSAIPGNDDKSSPYYIEMVPVPGGAFNMGGNVENDEKPIHKVTLSGFKMGRYDITQAQWKAVMETNPSYYKDCDQCPVENVSWDDAQLFIKKLNALTGKQYRLPTEAEWEYAARGGSQSRGYTYAGSNSIDDVAWYNNNSGGASHPVGGKKANELGLYDMAGNVFQWCGDWYGAYSAGEQTDPKGPEEGVGRVLRGGGWYGAAVYCRSAGRNIRAPDYHSNFNGFRLASPQ